jgi:hypothetical protein
MKLHELQIFAILLGLGAAGTFLWQVVINVFPPICNSEQRDYAIHPGWARTMSYEWHSYSCCETYCWNGKSQTCCATQTCYKAGINVDMYQRLSNDDDRWGDFIRTCELRRNDVFGSSDAAVNSIAIDYPLNHTFQAWYAESSACAWSKHDGTCIGTYVAVIFISLFGIPCAAALGFLMGKGIDLALVYLFCNQIDAPKEESSTEMTTKNNNTETLEGPTGESAVKN